MTAVNPIGTSTSTATTTGTGKSMSSLGINDFITLMVTQLKYQDPTSPQDATKFVEQLAQFSSVSGIQQMNTSMSSLLDQMRNSQALSATSLVGHQVLVAADTTSLEAGGQVSGMVETPTGATNINMAITDSSGQVVRQFSVPATSGTSSFTWDGLSDSGAQVPSGSYSLKAIALVNGKSQAADTLLTSKVGSVTIDTTDNSLLLNTNNLGAVKLADVRQVI